MQITVKKLLKNGECTKKVKSKNHQKQGANLSE